MDPLDEFGGTGDWVVEMPSGTKVLNANDRGRHWGPRHKLTKQWRGVALVMARKEKLPRLERARIVGVYYPPTRRHRDEANLAPTLKAIVDGFVDHGLLPDDNTLYLEGPYPKISDELRQGGQMVMHIYRLSPLGADGADPAT
ncbi:hypothetical protein GCM10022252_75380 [Streptosporangium oxazolinicum]|uniref:Uncharacterized protein n=1 Tax=Streptosporangium oxazolinicum TaxID=909287 RepID=A0ABP8BLU9_9ACTN